MVIRLVFYIVLSLTAQLCFAEELEPIRQGHAHNDYEHERPLFDALDNGFCSIEVDIFLVGGKFLVGHDGKILGLRKRFRICILILCVSALERTVAGSMRGDRLLLS